MRPDPNSISKAPCNSETYRRCRFEHPFLLQAMLFHHYKGYKHA